MVNAQSNDRTGRRPLGRGVGQFIGLINGQIRQAFHLQDATVENILFPFFGDREQAFLDSKIRDGIDNIPKGDARVQLSLELHKDRFWHVKGHEAESASKGDQP